MEKKSAGEEAEENPDPRTPQAIRLCDEGANHAILSEEIEVPFGRRGAATLIRLNDA